MERIALPAATGVVRDRKGAAGHATLRLWGGMLLFLAIAAGVAVLVATILRVSQGDLGLSDYLGPLSSAKDPGTPLAARPTYRASITEGLELPLGVAVSPGGILYVADGGCRCVQVYSAEGRLQATLGPRIGQEEVQYPVAVALDEGGRLYVSDLTAGRVLLFQEGEYLGPLALGDIPRLVAAPVGVVPQGNLLYVNDVSRHQVLVFDLLDGALVQVIGQGKGVGPGDLAYPNYALPLPDGSLLVADSNNNRLQRFSVSGVALESWTVPVSVPRGLARDRQGNIHAASAIGGRVEVFSAEGRYLGGYAQFAGGLEEFSFPTGIAIAGDRVYVADRANSKVQIGGWP